MRFWTVFSRWVGPGGPPLGGDTPPSGLPSPQDNLLVGDKSLTYRETGQTQRVAVAYAGSAQITADLFVYEEATGLWYKISAAPVALPPNVITFCDIAIPLSTAERLQGDATKPGGEFQAVLVPYNPGGLVNGEYKFAMAPNLSDPSSQSTGTSSNVNIVSPIPLPVSFSTPTTYWNPVTVGALVYSGTLKNVAGKIRQVHGFNDKNTRRYFMLFDSISPPANGAPSWMCLSVPGGGTFSIDLSAKPRSFSTGLSWAASSTPDTLTIDTSAKFWTQSEVE
jgi:hypothetical protein